MGLCRTPRIAPVAISSRQSQQLWDPTGWVITLVQDLHPWRDRSMEPLESVAVGADGSPCYMDLPVARPVAPPRPKQTIAVWFGVCPKLVVHPALLPYCIVSQLG